jgi:protein TonB
MEHAASRLQALTLDPKRIAATSAAVAVHVAALMLLMLPTRQAAPPVLVDRPSLVVVPQVRKIPKLIPLPIAHLPRPRPIREPRIQAPAPVDATPSPVDFAEPPAQPALPETSFEGPVAAPVFAQIFADVAPTPPYPAQARLRRLSGEVTLRIRVDALGRPTQASIESSSGSLLLDEAARKFVMARWHFVPATQDGRPIEAEALVPINFVLQQ